MRELLIRIYARSDDKSPYPVDAELDDGSYFFGGQLLVPQADLLKLEQQVLNYGTKLGQALFTEPILRALDRGFAAQAAEVSQQLRVRLCISPDAVELNAYPWERVFFALQGKQIPLAASSIVPFSRYLPLEQGQQTPVEERPIRLLLVASNPSRLPDGMQHIDVDKELTSLVNVLSSVNDLSVTVLPGRSGVGDALCKKIQDLGYRVEMGATTLVRLAELAGQHHIVHVLSHGLYEDGTASLFLEAENGDFAKAVDTEIVKLIGSLAAKPRLFYLSACDTAEQDADDITAAAGAAPKRNIMRPLLGLAPKLVQAGVPAVIAMQQEVEVLLAHAVAKKFYQRLLESGEVDRALSEARETVYRPETKQWAVPVLYLRLRDGRLFTTDPVRVAIDAAAQLYPKRADSFYLPLEAVWLKTPGLIQDWARIAAQDPAASELWKTTKDFRPGYAVLLGGAGAGKSTHLNRIARYNADPKNTGGKRVLPLVIDLRDYASVRGFNRDRLQSLLYQSLAKLSPAVTETRFESLLFTPGQVCFQFLLDRADELPDSLRNEAINDIERLAGQCPQHQYLLALDARWFQPTKAVTELLVIQPLSIRTVVDFLQPGGKPSDDHAKTTLLESIREAQLFDFAAAPWLLLHMLDRVRENAPPRSRTSVLQNWLENALYKVSDNGGERARARDSLVALAGCMHAKRCDSLPLDAAFSVLRDVRGQRDYNLEEVVDRLVDSGILDRIDNQDIRFAYPPLQSFCAALQLARDPHREFLFDEIAATLGQPSRVRWWAPALTLAAGMLKDPRPLLRTLVFGASLTRGEKVFVAAQCLLEYRREHPALPADVAAAAELEGLRSQIFAALLWRARRTNEPDYYFRERAVELLGLFKCKDSIPFLISLAVDKVRVVDGQEPQFEYSQVRFAAMRALRYLYVLREPIFDPSATACYPRAGDFIDAWLQMNDKVLADILVESHVGMQGVAAFALGDVQKPCALYTAFKDPKTDPATLWAISDALQCVDPDDVIENLVHPLIKAASQPYASALPDGPIYERLVFLIGQLRTHDTDAREFVTRYLRQPASATLKGRALVALARLRAADAAKEQHWTAVAQGDFTGIAAAAEQNGLNKLFLQRKAIEALGVLGDLNLLYEARNQPQWQPELDEVFFRAAEACMAISGAQQLFQPNQNGSNQRSPERILTNGG
jgi:hypothetical protein